MSKKAQRLVLTEAELKLANIPRKFWELAQMSYPGSDDAMEAVCNYVQRFDPRSNVGLMLRGPANSCKTFLGTFVLRNLLARGVTSNYVSLDYLSDAMFNPDKSVFSSIVRGHSLLFVDNVNLPRHEGQKNALLRAVRTRSDEGLPYILATQLPEKLFSQFYCIAVLHEIEGEDTVVRDSEFDTFLKRDLLTVLCSMSEESERIVNKAAKNHYTKP